MELFSVMLVAFVVSQSYMVPSGILVQKQRAGGILVVNSIKYIQSRTHSQYKLVELALEQVLDGSLDLVALAERAGGFVVVGVAEQISTDSRSSLLVSFVFFEERSTYNAVVVVITIDVESDRSIDIDKLVLVAVLVTVPKHSLA